MRKASFLELARQFALERKASRLASQIAIRQLIKEGKLSDKEILDFASIYPLWTPGVAYAVGDLVQYHGKLYEVVQAHTSQEDWQPDTVPALFKSTVPEGVPPEWVQPTGAHDAYREGDRVIYKGQTYESLIDGNVWSPEDYPEGWGVGVIESIYKTVRPFSRD